MLLLGVAVLIVLGYTPSLERWHKIVGLAFLAFIFPGLYTGDVVKEQIEPTFVYLVDVERGSPTVDSSK
ncbi:hypothetical protein ACFQMM_01145 [Saliphagus sp. GCM10025308]